MWVLSKVIESCFDNSSEGRIRKIDFGGGYKKIISAIDGLPKDKTSFSIQLAQKEGIFSPYFIIGSVPYKEVRGTPKRAKNSKDLRERIIRHLMGGGPDIASVGEKDIYAESSMANWHEVSGDDLYKIFQHESRMIDIYHFLPQVVETLKVIIKNNKDNINEVSLLMGISYGRLKAKEVLFSPMLRLSLKEGSKLILPKGLDLGGFGFDIFREEHSTGTIVEQSVFTLNWPWPCPPCKPPNGEVNN